MRFLLLPVDQGTTAIINFNHVTTINVSAQAMELHFIGGGAPTTLAQIAKGMDLSDTAKDQVNNL